MKIIGSRQIVEKMKKKLMYSSNDNPRQVTPGSQITLGVAGNIPAFPLLKRRYFTQSKSEENRMSLKMCSIRTIN